MAWPDSCRNPRGPKGAHKLNLEAMAFVERHLEGDGSIHARALAEQLESELGIPVHLRSIERAIARKKNRRTICRHPSPRANLDCCLRGATRRGDRSCSLPRGYGGDSLSRHAAWTFHACDDGPCDQRCS